MTQGSSFSYSIYLVRLSGTSVGYTHMVGSASSGRLGEMFGCIDIGGIDDGGSSIAYARENTC